MATYKLEKREIWIDELKGFASLSVVLGHVAVTYLNIGQFVAHRNILLWLHNSFYAFHMPLYFIISGLVFGLAYSQPDGTLKRPRIKIQMVNMLMLYFLWNILLGVSKTMFSAYVVEGTNFSDLLWIPLKAIDLSWYLYTLILCYCLTLLTWKRVPVTVLLVVSGICCLVEYWVFLPMQTITAFKVPMYYFFFLLGFLLKQNPAVLDKISRSETMLMNFAFGAGILCAWCFAVRPGESVSWSYIPLFGALMALALSAFLIGLLKKIAGVICFRVLSLVGVNSLEIYIMHPFIITGLRIILPHLGITGFCASMLFFFLLTPAISIIISSILKKIGLHDIIFRPATYFQEKKANSSDAR